MIHGEHREQIAALHDLLLKTKTTLGDMLGSETGGICGNCGPEDENPLRDRAEDLFNEVERMIPRLDSGIARLAWNPGTARERAIEKGPIGVEMPRLEEALARGGHLTLEDSFRLMLEVKDSRPHTPDDARPWWRWDDENPDVVAYRDDGQDLPDGALYEAMEVPA